MRLWCLSGLCLGKRPALLQPPFSCVHVTPALLRPPSPRHSALPPKAWYVLHISTSDLRGAGSDADMHVALSGAQGTSGRINLPSRPEQFQRGQRDTFRCALCVCVCVCVCARVRACRAAGCWALRDRVCGEHVRRPSHTAIGAPGGVFAGCCCRRWASCGSCWWATTTTGSPQPGTCRWWRWSRRTAGALCSLQLTGARACACAVRKCAKVCTRQASRLMCA
jgi:hypothetical protein